MSPHRVSFDTHNSGGKIDFEGRKKKLLFQRKKIEPKRASERQKKKLRIGNYFYNLSDGNKGKERVSGRQHEICAPLSTFVSVWLARFRHRNHGELLPRLSLSVSPGFCAILSSFRSSKLSVRVGENPRKSLHDRIQIHHDGWRFPLTTRRTQQFALQWNSVILAAPLATPHVTRYACRWKYQLESFKCRCLGAESEEVWLIHYVS